MNRKHSMTAALLLLLSLALPATAATLPEYYPESFDRSGVINRVDVDNRVIVIDDSKVQLSLNLKVYTPTTRFATIRSLKPGMRIGFGTTGSRAAHNSAVPELWVLPDDYTPKHMQRMAH